MDNLAATVTTQGTALATLEGNAAATLAFRAKAGTAGAQLELVAQSNPGGASSTARISADEIILNGTVKAAQMQVGTITAASGILADAVITNAKIANGAITSAKIGDAQITSAKIGDLQVNSAKIANLTVGTDKISDFAVTTGAGVQGFGAASASCLGGRTVLIWASISAQGMSAEGSGWIGAQVYFNGVLLGQYTFGANGDTGFAPIFVRTSQAGTNTIQTIYVQSGSSVSGNLTVSGAFLELKK